MFVYICIQTHVHTYIYNIHLIDMLSSLPYIHTHIHTYTYIQNSRFERRVEFSCVFEEFFGIRVKTMVLTLVCMFLCMCMCVCVYACMRVGGIFWNTCEDHGFDAGMYVCMYARHVCMCMCMCVYVCVCMHILHTYAFA
jgi:hypothetical protein